MFIIRKKIERINIRYCFKYLSSMFESSIQINMDCEGGLNHVNKSEDYFRNGIYYFRLQSNHLDGYRQATTTSWLAKDRQLGNLTRGQFGFNNSLRQILTDPGHLGQHIPRGPSLNCGCNHQQPLGGTGSLHPSGMFYTTPSKVALVQIFLPTDIRLCKQRTLPYIGASCAKTGFKTIRAHRSCVISDFTCLQNFFHK